MVANDLALSVVGVNPFCPKICIEVTNKKCFNFRIN